MKNKKMNKLTVVAAVILNMGAFGVANAQILAKQPVAGYPGLAYPEPQQSQLANKNVPGLENLMSNQITADQVKDKDTVSEMRKSALREIAGQLGSSNGLAFRMNQLKRETDVKSAQLDTLFDFNKTTIDNGVLAPVLTEGAANYAQNSDDQVRIADKIYKIETPAKFVSVYPTWRSYLRFTYPSFETPDQAYLPKNDTEKAIWDAAVKEGWDKGVTQANRIYESSYARLERDYLGMVKYKILLAQGLITPTVIAKQNLGVTGGGKEMSVNDQIFRITDHSALNPENKEWKVEYPVTNKVDGQLK
jgi:defect-in-organelle-trafficking protein DotC